MGGGKGCRGVPIVDKRVQPSWFMEKKRKRKNSGKNGRGKKVVCSVMIAL